MSGIDHRAETKDKKTWKTFFLKTKKVKEATSVDTVAEFGISQGNT